MRKPSYPKQFPSSESTQIPDRKIDIDPLPSSCTFRGILCSVDRQACGAMKPIPRTLRKKRQSGNTMIELALTFLPTFALLFAFIDFGMAIFVLTTLQNAVREGCRYAITYQTGFGGATGQDQSIKNVVASYSMGFAS